jgi:glutaredoxin 3
MSDSSQAIKMYRTRSCPFCVMAAQLLDGMGIEFEEISLDGHANRREFTNSILPGHYTVPLVMVGEQAIGGFDELRALQAAGTLAETLGQG